LCFLLLFLRIEGIKRLSFQTSSFLFGVMITIVFLKKKERERRKVCNPSRRKKRMVIVDLMNSLPQQ